MTQIRRNKHNNRLFKKHSSMIAKLALDLGLITPKFFNDLYWTNYRRKKNKRWGYGKYNIKIQYYTELYFATCDYWGEWDERSLIDYVFYLYVERLNDYPNTKKDPTDNISLIKELRNGLQHNKVYGTKTKQLRINRTHIPRQRSRKNKVLRLRKYHY